jgi:hypothetical protein
MLALKQTPTHRSYAYRYGHGAEQYTHADRLLVGAKRPHVPKIFTLYRDEVLVRAELEWDSILRWANFTSSL